MNHHVKHHSGLLGSLSEQNMQPVFGFLEKCLLQVLIPVVDVATNTGGKRGHWTRSALYSNLQHFSMSEAKNIFTKMFPYFSGILSCLQL